MTINRGINAATVVSIAEITGIDILDAATTGACELSSFLLVFKYEVCSPTTIASSTTMPRAIIKPNNDIIFIDCPVTNITANVARNAIGIPNATQIAVLRLKNRKSTAKTIQRPLNPFLTSKEILS